MKKLTTVLLAAASLSVAQAATSPSSLSGAYVGLSAGAAVTTTKYNVQSSGASAGGATTLYRNISTDSGKLAGLFGAFGGYGVQMNSFYVGGELFGGFDTSKANTLKDNTNTVTGTFAALYQAQIKRTHFYGLAARLGYMVTPSTLAYVRLGIESGKWTATVTPNNAAIDQAVDNTLTNSGVANGANSKKIFTNSKNSISFAPGLGLEVSLAKNVMMRFEYTYLFGPKVTVNQDISGYGYGDFGGSNAAHTFNVSQHAVKLGLSYRFAS